jgi:hypothetical protein
MILTAGLGKIDETHNSRKEVCEGKQDFWGVSRLGVEVEGFTYCRRTLTQINTAKKGRGTKTGPKTQDPKLISGTVA